MFSVLPREKIIFPVMFLLSSENVLILRLFDKMYFMGPQLGVGLLCKNNGYIVYKVVHKMALTLSQTTNFRLFQIGKVYRRQF